jgi:lysozyme
MAWPLLALLLLAWLPACGAPPGPPLERSGCTVEALEQCPTATVEGIDVFDGQGAIDWDAVADAGVAFAFIKATQGTYDAQSTFEANWAGARRAGVLRGAYHFFDPTEDGALQAQAFLATLGRLEAGDLPAMLDIECPDGDANCLGAGFPGDAPAGAIAMRMGDWLRAVEGATGAKPLVYTFGSYFASRGISTAGLAAYPLFLSEPVTSMASAECLDVPSPWSRATLWQYSWSGRVSGVESAVDRDRFLGPRDELEGLVVGVADASPGSGEASTAGPAGCY